jgi:hypothetical protein
MEQQMSADKQYMQEVAEVIQSKLPDSSGFIALVLTPSGDDRRVFYVSNLSRQDAVALLKEWLIKAGHGEDWMKHLE